MKDFLWSVVLLGVLVGGIIGYAVLRVWNRWKEWRRQRQAGRQNASTSSETDAEVSADDGSEDVPDEELCVICLTRRRISTFIPCGHLICCQVCAISVERTVSPRCPVCRSAIQRPVRIENDS